MSSIQPHPAVPEGTGAAPEPGLPSTGPTFQAPSYPATSYPPPASYPAPGPYAGQPAAAASAPYPAQAAAPSAPYPAQAAAPSAPYPAQAAQPYVPAQPYAGQQYPPQQYPAQTYLGQPYATQAPYAPPPNPVAPTAPGTERVGRGVLFSLGGIAVGVLLTVVLWKLNFFASFTSFAMAYAVVWLYALGAGRAPAKGAPAVIGVIVAGVAACLASLIAVDTVTAISSAYPDAPLDLLVSGVVENLLNPGIWSQYSREVLMYLFFAALGTFGLIRQLGRARRA